ncbi:type II toxin-antitoxin system HipA family toxin [Citrobacter sp. Igbk 16]|uniref:type II toxin-antitoxin system HipA family toxin n=1 Tax=Citrobacter sp. Igbk 16 TaxID=2963958 RepID=UPI00230209AD|nr:type II toxin-antitoxin system HipA family toxin [Citrobacter sp. Igbk 16]MDA8516253.1 type II toxin-antitoxin system HipA family toxin [Citrobacter sp. Igbk 16]
MHRKKKRLAIWLNGALVGFWEKSRGEDRLQYLPEWVADEQSIPLSLSLPFTPGNQLCRGDVVRNYFDNLLPDSENIRRRLAMRYRAGSPDPFDLLAELGRDCAGAIQLLPTGEDPTDALSVNCRPLSETEVATILRNTTVNLAICHEHVHEHRFCIAGAQEKTALLWHKGKWCLPLGHAATTHIFKLPLGLVGNMQADMSTSVENEWLCSLILEHYGMPVAKTQIAQFEDQKALIVERFDRAWSGDRQIVRLPQEDMCQALGISPRRKYQSEGGPGVSDIMGILRHSEQAKSDMERFFKAQILFWVMAAIDGHAKNFSITSGAQNRYRLAPLYDVLSAWPVMGQKNSQISWKKCRLAMAIRGSNNYYPLWKIQRRHWIHHGELTGLTKQQVELMIDEIISRAPEVIERVSRLLPDSFTFVLAESVFQGIRRQCGRLAKNYRV